jgi:hypothetical protein
MNITEPPPVKVLLAKSKRDSLPEGPSFGCGGSFVCFVKQRTNRTIGGLVKRGIPLAGAALFMGWLLAFCVMKGFTHRPGRFICGGGSVLAHGPPANLRI